MHLLSGNIKVMETKCQGQVLLRGVKCRQSGLQREKLDKMCPPRVTNPKQETY